MEKYEIKKVIVKENNGGGISYEAYDGNGNIIAVVTGIEQQRPQPDYEQEAHDLIDCKWSYSDASQWYDAEGNSMGDLRKTKNEQGKDIYVGEITATDVIDNHWTTKILAEIE